MSPKLGRLIVRMQNLLGILLVLASTTLNHGTVEAEVLQQAFRISPNDVEAHIGEEVVMHCEVDHRAGMVQWAKDGFVLGFNNEIEGFPRFSLNQNHSSGIYNLRITNASYEDAANYQCQVGPAKNNRPIRAGAKLTVLGSMKNRRGMYHRN
ncbi:kin of IRRE-like protein 1 [Toxorhynchites rutilus septentrionalis]|uniref:kin of IRRE-like protein 1 n=1 Tax=Toxorhynchites rutilus septentrionalis TaxID=329112 RepID=UPI00247A2DC5|nr:kin of IRRE-like protein 1 [Toxorhynchites rutilus septentrionalis]XP_055630582.1 kin of IRRE-like protein 1 [Toxorhynchites rutilus septentrionalis]